MTMFIYINNDGPFPTEEKVSGSCSECHGDAEPRVVRHED